MTFIIIISIGDHYCIENETILFTFQLRPDEYNRYEAKLHELQQSLTGAKKKWINCWLLINVEQIHLLSQKIGSIKDFFLEEIREELMILILIEINLA